MYSVKVGVTADGKYYGAGMAIGIENTPEGIQSQVLFDVGRFALINQITGSSTITTPFVVQGGQVFINTAIIGDATINFAKISDTLQSTNYVQNVSGWKLYKDGTFEINGTSAGNRMKITNSGLVIYDSNNIARVELGLNLS